MKYSNFKLTKRTGFNALNWVYFAEVDETSGFLFWKKTRTRQLRRKYAGFWHFIDDGEFVPDDVRRLALAEEATIEYKEAFK